MEKDEPMAIIDVIRYDVIIAHFLKCQVNGSISFGGVLGGVFMKNYKLTITFKRDIYMIV